MWWMALALADPPRLASGDEPEVPIEAMDLGVEAVDCPLALTLDASGAVTGVEVDCIGFLAERVERAARNWRFEPATEDGVAVPSTYTHTVHFQVYPEGGGMLGAEAFARLVSLHLPVSWEGEGCWLKLGMKDGVPRGYRSSDPERCLVLPVEARPPGVERCHVRFVARGARARDISVLEGGKPCEKWMKRIADWRWLSLGEQPYEVDFRW